MDGHGRETVVITGASRGLGAALAEAFAREGWNVAICARGEDSLEPVTERVRAEGGRCLARAVDVTDEPAVAAWIDEVARELGPPSALINNASVLGPRVALEEYPVDAWREAIEINLNGAFIVARAVLPWMRRAGGGSIVNVSSGAAIPPRRKWGAYAVSKQAVEGLTMNLAAELEGTGVRVNAVDPGAMRTEMRAEAYPAEDPRTVKTAAETTPVFLWLASDGARGVSGERLRADDWHGPPPR